MPCKVLIIDDEPLARNRMRSLLEVYPDDVEIIGEASSATQAVEKIKTLHPDLIFLDIQMPDKNAFEMLQDVQDEEFLIVFTTAFDHYALNSFEEDVLDYLLKPIAEERLQKTIEKIRNMFPQKPTVPTGQFWDKLNIALSHLNQQYLQRVQVKIGNKIILVPIDEVIRFKSEDKYTVVYTLTNQYIIDTPLIELEVLLDPRQFVRVHRAHLLAADYIAEIQREEAGRLCVVLKDKYKTVVPVSRTFVKRVRSL